MCLAIPMRVMQIEGLMARCEARGIERQVSLLLLEPESIAPGDMVSVHLGHAVMKMSTEDACAAWALYDDMLAIEWADRPIHRADLEDSGPKG